MFPIGLVLGSVIVVMAFTQQQIDKEKGNQGATLAPTPSPTVAAKPILNSGEPASSELPIQDIPSLATTLRKQSFLVKVFDEQGGEIATGSAIAVADHLVVTNYHVLEWGVRALAVQEGTEYRVEGIKAFDSQLDLAILRINKPVSPVTFGDTARLQVGDRVLAVGNPLGLEGSVSEGMVGGFRQFGNRKLIQSSASTSRGSSGGGLFDLRGGLVGITTLVSLDGSSIGLAIPVEEVTKLLASVGQVPRKVSDARLVGLKGRVKTVTQFDAFTGPKGRYSKYDEQGQLVENTDLFGSELKFIVKNPSGTKKSWRRGNSSGVYTYDFFGTETEWQWDANEQKYSASVTWRFSFDGKRVEEVVSRLKPEEPETAVYQFDNAANLVNQTVYSFDRKMIMGLDFRYDANNLLMEKRTWSPEKGWSDPISCQNIQVDRYGNWLRRVCGQFEQRQSISYYS